MGEGAVDTRELKVRKHRHSNGGATQCVKGRRCVGKSHKAGMIEGAYFAGQTFDLRRGELMPFTQRRPEAPPEERLIGGVLWPRAGISCPRVERRSRWQRRRNADNLPFKTFNLRLVKGDQRIIAVKNDGLDVHGLDHKSPPGPMQWAKSTARRLLKAMHIVSDMTPAGTAALNPLLDRKTFAAQRAHPRYQPGYTLAALAGGQLLGAAHITHERRRIGAAVLDVATVRIPGELTLHPALLEPVVAAAAAAELAWLQIDLPVTADPLPGLAICRLKSRLQLAFHVGRAPVLRPAAHADVADLTALGAALAAAAPLSYERTAADWRWLVTTLGDAIQVLEDERGRLAGYAVCGPDPGFSEAYAADAGVGRALLDALSAQGRNEGRLDPGHPLTHTALVHGGRSELSVPGQGHIAPHWGVIDLTAALTDLAPELGVRVRRSRYAGWQGRVQVEVGGRRVGLRLTGEAVEVEQQPVRAPDVAVQRIALSAVPQLLLGYRTVADLRASGALQCAESDFGLLDGLFPVIR
jgi:hypothetical protein